MSMAFCEIIWRKNDTYEKRNWYYKVWDSFQVLLFGIFLPEAHMCLPPFSFHGAPSEFEHKSEGRSQGLFLFYIAHKRQLYFESFYHLFLVCLFLVKCLRLNRLKPNPGKTEVMFLGAPDAFRRISLSGVDGVIH